MTRRAMFRGNLLCADLRVPVKLYAAVESTRINFHMLHDKDDARLRQVLVCEKEDVVVPREELVKGLALGDGRYVLIDEAELAALQPETDRRLQLDAFVDPLEVDPRLFERPYHLGADGEDEKYAAFAEAVAASGRWGICRWAFRRRDYVGLLRSAEGVLELVTLRLGDAVRPASELEIGTVSLSAKERRIAGFLVDEMAGTFTPENYKDDFAAALRNLIDTKLAGGKAPVRRALKPASTPSADLSAALEASLSQLRAGSPTSGKKSPDGSATKKRVATKKKKATPRRSTRSKLANKKLSRPEQD